MSQHFIKKLLYSIIVSSLCCAIVFAQHKKDTTPYPTPVPDYSYLDIFPLGLACSQADIGIGQTWNGLTIGESTIKDFEELFGKTEQVYDMLVSDVGYIGNICAKDGVIVAMQVGSSPDLQYLSDYVALYGISDAVTYGMTPFSRLAFWFEEGMAIDIYINPVNPVFYQIVGFVTYFPYQPVEDFQERWPYANTASEGIPDGDINVSDEQNPFDFEAMIATLTAEPSQTPSDTSTPTPACPTIPDGLAQVSNLEWYIHNESIKLDVGKGNVSDSLQTTFLWDLFSGRLDTFRNEDTPNALGLVDRLDKESDFFSDNKASHLSLSTVEGSKYALFVSGEIPTLFALDTDTLEQQELGQLNDNLSDLDVFWYGEDKAIIVVEPIYGNGFGLYDVAIEDSSLIDLTEILGYLPERPAIDTSGNRLAVYSASLSKLDILDLKSKAVIQEFSIPYQLLQNTYPIWSEDGQAIYFLGFDDSLTDYVVYRLDLSSGNIEPVVNLGSEIDVEDWVLIPDEKILIWSDGDVHIYCYE